MNRIEEFLKYMQQEAPAFAQEAIRSRNSDQATFDTVASLCLKIADAQLKEKANEILVEGYCFFVTEVNRAQVEYEQTKHYKYSSFEEVFAQAYDNEEFMTLYHWGVFATTFCWQHHLKLAKFFYEEFLPKITSKLSLLDLGCGSGIWHLLALQHLTGLNITAIDVSQTSIELCKETAQLLNLASPINYQCADALNYKPEKPFSLGISCFLLEHLEQPKQLLQVLSDSLEERGWAFITCALTAAELDHIYEFKYEHEVLQMLQSVGLRTVISYSSAPQTAPSKRHFLPRSMMCIVQKTSNEIW